MDTKEPNKQESRTEDSPALADLELTTKEGEEKKGAISYGQVPVYFHVIEKRS